MTVRVVSILLAISLTTSSYAEPAPAGADPSIKPAASKPAKKEKSSAKGAGAPSTAASAVSGPCVGVIPLIGDRFAVKKIGITVFGNEYKEIPVPTWGFDDLVVERVRAAVGPAVTVRRVNFAPGAFDAYRPGFSFNANYDGHLAEALGKSGSQVKCDRYVVVIKANETYIGNQSIYGIGIVNSGRPIRSQNNIHAAIRIQVHDGHTYAMLKGGAGSTNGNNLIFRGNVHAVDDTWFPEQPEGADTPAMRAAARSLLADVLDKSLPPLLTP